jgi:uncharacterized protein
VSAIRLVRDALGRAPTAFGHALVALDLYLGPSREVAIIGSLEDPGTRALMNEVLRERFLPNVVLACAPEGTVLEGPALLENRPQVGGTPTAYVCEHFSCRLPVTRPEDLAKQLAVV